MTVEPDITYEFDPFRLDRRTLILSRDGVAIRLSPKASRLLLLLIEAHGQMVSKDDLLSTLWPGTFVEEGNLTFQIHELRKALGDRKGGTTYIETIPRRGYRFVAAVSELRRDQETRDEVATAAESTLSAHASGPLVSDELGAGERFGRSFWVPFVAAGGLAIGLFGWYMALARPAPPPHVTRYVRVTHDGRVKGQLAPYDRSHIVTYIEGRSVLVDLENGRLLDTPLPAGYVLLDVSEARQEALAVRPDDRGAECALWVVPLKDGGPRRLGSICGGHAAWSPDGRRIAYTWMSGLFVTSPDGLVVETLATFSGAPQNLRWSLDGRSIRFHVVVGSNRTTTSTILEIQSDGTRLHQVAAPPSAESWDCCGNWMPDGNDFTFQSNRDGRQRLWLLHDESPMFGSPSLKLVKLTDGPLEFFEPLPSRDGKRLYAVGRPAEGRTFRYNPATQALEPYLAGVSVWWVDYSPNGRQIAYVSEPDRHLWIANADGSQARQLPIAPIVDVDACAWAPDGKRIAFRGAERGRHHKVYLIAPDGGPPTPLTTEDVEQGIATWSPDSMHLTFGDVPEQFGHPTGSEAIHVYDLSTGTDQIVPGSDGLWTSRWSPDGRYLAALTIRGQELMLLNWTRRVWQSMKIEHVDNPTWSRDGKYLYFAPEGNVDRPLSRLRIADGTVEGLVAIRGPVEHWSGVTPDNVPIVLAADWDIYALDLK